MTIEPPGPEPQPEDPALTELEIELEIESVGEDRPQANECQTSERYQRALADHRRHHRSLLPEAWTIRLPAFEGPLDLLLHLLRVNEVDVHDIPVALICDQYHEYLELMEHLDLDIAGEFIYEAALLIQLKSKMLLPQPEAAPGEEPAGDPRRELVARLLEYQRLREAAEAMAEVSSMRSGILTREWQKLEAADSDDGDIDLGDLSLFDLLQVFRKVLDSHHRAHPDPLVVRAEAFSVRDQILRLLERLTPGRALDLVDDLLALSCRAEAIAAFLALLEMCRLQLIRLHQTADGGLLMFRTERELVAEELEAIVA